MLVAGQIGAQANEYRLGHVPLAFRSLSPHSYFHMERAKPLIGRIFAMVFDIHINGVISLDGSQLNRGMP